jgi:ASC-1-like (ASCH) protein
MPRPKGSKNKKVLSQEEIRQRDIKRKAELRFKHLKLASPEAYQESVEKYISKSLSKKPKRTGTASSSLEQTPAAPEQQEGSDDEDILAAQPAAKDKSTSAGSSGIAQPAAKIESASTDTDKALLLQMRRPHYDAIKDGRKKWEARPVQCKKKQGGWQQTIFDKLATAGRTVVLQSGAGTNDRLQISEVRRYIGDDCVELHALRNMVRELGSDLLPDTADEKARIEVYKSIYGEQQCSKGFVAMRVEWPAQGQSSTNMRFKQRTCNSASGCGKITCDSCYPPGDTFKKRQ